MSLGKSLVLIASPSQSEAQAVAAVFDGMPGLCCEIQLTSLASDHPLTGRDRYPDVFILLLNKSIEQADAQLRWLSEIPVAIRPPTLVVGINDNIGLLRLAMQAGARDYFGLPLVPGEIQGSVERILFEQAGTFGRLTAVVGAKGGSGASFLATNIASLLASRFRIKTALMDLDFQFGRLALDMDVVASYSIAEIVEHIDEIDAKALEAYMTKHASGLHLLAYSMHEFILPGEIKTAKLERLIRLARQAYKEIIVDMPRYVDSASSAVFMEADQILVVMRQSVGQAKDCMRLLTILQNELEVPSSRIRIVMNRFDPQFTMSLREFEETLHQGSIMTIPDDWKNVSAASNLGKPLFVYAPKSPVCKSLEALAREISGVRPTERRKGLFAHWFTSNHKTGTR